MKDAHDWIRPDEEFVACTFSASQEALAQGVSEVEPEHFLLGILKLPNGKDLLLRHGLEPDRVLASAGPDTGESPRVDDHKLSDRSKRAIERAHTICMQAGEKTMTLAHLLLAIREESGRQEN